MVIQIDSEALAVEVNIKKIVLLFCGVCEKNSITMIMRFDNLFLMHLVFAVVKLNVWPYGLIRKQNNILN